MESKELTEEQLRDQIAIEAMRSMCDEWNSEISKEYRENMLNYWKKEYGDISVSDCIAKDSYHMADAMLKARKESKE